MPRFHPSPRRFGVLHPYVSHLCRFPLVTSSQEPSGLPGFLDVSLPACHGLMTPPDLHILANSDASVLPSVHVKTLGDPELTLSKLYQHFRERGLPYGLQDALSTLASHFLFAVTDSSVRPRLDTGGWLALTRRGLSPRKIRRASPSAITPQIRRPKKQSAAALFGVG